MGCRRGAWGPVNGGFGSSWAFSPHLRGQRARLAFQTLSPVTRETLAAPPSHLHLPSPPTPPPCPPAPDITPSLEVMLREETKVSPSGGGLQPAPPTVSTLLLLPVSVHQPMLTR